MKINYWAKLETNRCYHIYNRAVGKENLFVSPRNYGFFIERWKKYIAPFFSTYAFCLMPNHFHFLAKAKSMTPKIKTQIEALKTNKGRAFLEAEISENDFYTSLFKAMFNSYSLAFNKEQKRRGSLFQAKFKRTLIRDEEHFKYMLQYIHNNPIHHGFRSKMDEWEYSSYLIYLFEVESWLAQEPALKAFGSLEEFKKSHQKFRIKP